jgi:hypothetical protein
MWMELQAVPDDGDPLTYHRIIKAMRLKRMKKQSPYAASTLEPLEDDFSAKLRYLFNGIRIWCVPNVALDVEINRSLAEDPCPKDKWYSTSDLMAFSYPPLPDDQVRELPPTLFGPGSYLQERYPDPEVQGGKIALIAVKQNRMHKPPNFLDRMRTTLMKQVAYNQRIIEAEHEIAGINCDIGEFVSEMSRDPAEQLVICVNGSEEMKRDGQAIGGQPWMQNKRMMTASNTVLDGMPNTKEAAILSAVAEAATWRNNALEGQVSEAIGPRKGQRVVIYPKELTQLHAVLTTGDPNIDSENGHPIAYERVLIESEKYENPPLFLREDAEQIVNDPVMAESVPKWLCMAERVATGNRHRVLEDGPDTWNSDDEAKEDVVPDKEVGMYTAGMDPKKGPVTFSQHEVARQKAAAQALKRSKSQPPRPPTPGPGSSDDDDPDGSDMIWSQSRQIFRKNKAKVLSNSSDGNSVVSSRVPSLVLSQQAIEYDRESTPLTSPVNSYDEGMSEDQRRQLEKAKKMANRGSKPSSIAPLRALSAPWLSEQKTQKSLPAALPMKALPAPLPEPVPEAKASKPTKGKGQESPRPAADPHPMATRRQRTASGAGGLRSGGGSGQTDTRVTKGHPSKT